MKTKIDEIADRIYRLSTFLPTVGPSGFTFNQFLVDAEQPLHGSSYSGAAAPALESLAGFYDDLLRQGAAGKPDVA